MSFGRRNFPLKIALVTGPTGERLRSAFESLGAEVVAARAVDLVAAPQTRIEAEIRRILDARPTWTIATTDRGLLSLLNCATPRERLVEFLAKATNVAARGLRVARAARTMGFEPALIAESGRSTDLVGMIADKAEAGSAIGLQASGNGSVLVRNLLERLGYSVLVTQPYRYSYLTDLARLAQVVRQVAEGTASHTIFTSGAAVMGFVQVAEDEGAIDDVRAAMSEKTLAVGVGHSACEALEHMGIRRSTCPPNPSLRSLPAFVLALCDKTPRHLLELDSSNRAAGIGGCRIRFGPQEFRLLSALARRPGILCTRRALMVEVWGREVETNRLASLVHRLRQEVRVLGLEIESMRRRGYRLRVEDVQL